MSRAFPSTTFARLALAWLLIFGVPSVAEATEAGLLHVHANAIADLHAGKDVATGTQAAWAPDHASLVFASTGPASNLIVRSWRNGTAVDRVLPVPAIETALELQWQWSFSPDGRWLAVRRWAHPRYYFPHGGTEAVRREADRVRWLGVIDMESMSARTWTHWGAILGWREGACLLSEDYYRPIFAVDPRHPESARKLLENSGALAGLSPDGKWAVIFDGRDGNAKVTLHELGDAPLRVLFDDPLRRNGSHAQAGSAEGAFSPTGARLAITTLWHEKGGWKTSVRLESLDGRIRAYEDRFDIEDTDDMTRAVWAGGKAERFAYMRFRKGRKDGELVIVELRSDTAVATEIRVKARPTERLHFPLLWSPRGDQVAWLAAGRSVVAGRVNTGATSVVGRLPSDATSWSWASPRVGGIVTQR